MSPTPPQAAQNCLTLTWNIARQQLNAPGVGANCLRMAFHGKAIRQYRYVLPSRRTGIHRLEDDYTCQT